MYQDHPRQDDRKLPLIALGSGLDMMWWHVIVHVDVDRRVL